MIQFNLLPDVKLEYIRARRAKRTLATLAVLVSGVSAVIVVFLFLVVNVFQTKNLSDIDKDINQQLAILEESKDLDKILTIQNQLNSLPALHDQKPVASRLYTFLPQIVPQNVSISNLEIDFTTQIMSVTGTADSISTINKFVDTIKFTDYELENSRARAFSDVVLESFDRGAADAGYTIAFRYNPILFDIKSSVKLIVQKGLITTRSETEKPAENLFVPLDDQEQEGGRP